MEKVNTENRQRRRQRGNVIAFGLFRTPPGNESFRFFSFPWSRYISAVLFLTVGFIALELLGYSIGPPGETLIGEYKNGGTAFFLGGPSFFYPVGLPPILFGIYLLISAIYGTFYGKVWVKDDIINFAEIRPIPVYTQISKEEITGVEYDTNRFGNKFFWPAVFVPSAIGLMLWGLPLFDEPRAETVKLPAVMLAVAVVYILNAFLMSYFMQHTLRIFTREKFYEWRIHPCGRGRTGRDLFGVISAAISGMECSKNKFTFDTVIDSRARGYRMYPFWLGSSLTVLGIVSSFGWMLFGYLWNIPAIAFGSYLMLNSLFRGAFGTLKIGYDKNSGELRYLYSLGRVYREGRIVKIGKVMLGKRPLALHPFEVPLLSILVVLTMQQLIYAWTFLDNFGLLAFFDVLFLTLFGLLVMYLIWKYAVEPYYHLMIEGLKYGLNWNLLYFPADLHDEDSEVPKILAPIYDGVDTYMETVNGRKIIYAVFTAMGLASALMAIF